MADPIPSTGADAVPTLDAPLLRRAGRGIAPPFRLMLEASGDDRELLVTDILRLLPDKRIVVFADRQAGPEAVAKIYLDPRHGRRHFTREIRGLEALRAADIPTPEILFQGTLEDGRTPVLLTRRIKTTRPLGKALATDADRQLEAVTVCLARMHTAGLSQGDAHPDNFLCSNAEVLVIDGAAIQQHGARSLARGPSIANLGLFLAQNYPDDDALIPHLMAIYCRARGWTPSAALTQRVVKTVQRWSDWREKKYLQKTVRPCTAFRVRTSWQRITACDRNRFSPSLARLLEDPDAAMAAGSILKAGNSATVVRIEGDSEPLVVKRYNLKNRRHALARALRPTRARLSWRNANRLRFMGVATPQPLALLEHRWGPLRGRAYFIAEYLAGEPFTEVVARREEFALLTNCADQLVHLLKRLQKLRLSHGDLKASNLLWHCGRLYLLDLDSMRKHRRQTAFQRSFGKDIRRLLENWRHDAVFTALLKSRLREIDPNV